MALIEKILIDESGIYDHDKREITFEWLVFSDNAKHFSVDIIPQGIVPPGNPLIGSDGRANGWHPPGTPFPLGPDCYAGAIEVSDRQIIKGDGYFKIDAKNMEIVINHNADRIVMWKVKQTYSTENELVPDPEADPPMPSEEDKFTVTVNFEWEDVPFMFDAVTGQRVVNSAGMPFSRLLLRDAKFPSMR